jgi:hypothetical protein
MSTDPCIIAVWRRTAHDPDIAALELYEIRGPDDWPNLYGPDIVDIHMVEPRPKVGEAGYGQLAGARCVLRWRQAGRKANAIIPSKLGTDFADLWADKL